MSTAEQVTPPVSLIADPHEDTRTLYTDCLERSGWQALHAGDGAIALSLALSARPQLLVTELRLPRVDGFNLISILKREPALDAMRIVVVTGEARIDALNRARRAGADEVFAKPVDLSTLFERIETLMHRNADLRATSDALHSRVGQAVADAEQTLRASRTLARSIGYYATTTPPNAPPSLACPRCAGPLNYDHSHIGGLNQPPEQWDYYDCPRRCGKFQYRHRTRKLRQVS